MTIRRTSIALSSKRTSRDHRGLRRPDRLVVVALGFLLLALSGVGARAEEVLRLEDLERMALKGNPTLSQAQASIGAAEGRHAQAGLYPNPIIGYELEDLNSRDPGRNKNFFWFQVPIVTGGKLQRARDLALTDRRHAEVNAEIQRFRVLTTVRMLYYEALGTAQTLELWQELVTLTREAVEVSEDLLNVGQADQPDLLEVEIQAQRAELDLAKAKTRRDRIWRTLAATVGNPSLPPAELEGTIGHQPPDMNRDHLIAKVLRESPELQLAQVNVDRARAALERVRAEQFPDLYFRTKLGYNSESYSPGKDVGFEAGVEIGIPLPIFNRQQGNLRTAEAELEQAQSEVRRLELALRSQLEASLGSHMDARAEVERFEREILPRAQRSVGLYQQGFQQMAAAYPQVLIAQRMLLQARVEHVQALVELWRTAALLDGMLLSGGLEPAFHASVWIPTVTGHVPGGSGRGVD